MKFVVNCQLYFLEIYIKLKMYILTLLIYDGENKNIPKTKKRVTFATREFKM